MKIGAQGQVVIPAELVEQAGFRPDDELSVRIDSGVLTIRAANDRPQAAQDRGRALIEHMQRYRSALNMTTDEVMAMTRGE
jgi:bifunctional DNA-binding transcriptional regulator/antitoxin component of YhaV-PrlF toxin-antitoxin module